MASFTFIDTDQSKRIADSFDVFGSTGNETAKILSGTEGVVVKASIERVELSKAVAAYTFKVVGTNVEVYEGSTLVATVAAQSDADGTIVAFADGSAQMKLTGLGAATLGDVTIPSDAAATVEPTAFDTTDKSTVADGSTPSPDPDPTPGPGNTVFLTSGTDRFPSADEDTAGDTFYDAPIVQNAFAGGVSNSLSTADRIVDASGVDTLRAEVIPEFIGASGSEQMEIQPRIKNVENIYFEAMDYKAGQPVTIDAKNIEGVERIGSSYSDGDLVIENLTTKGVGSTKKMTVVMDHTDNFNSDRDASDLTVLFDEDYLTTESTPEGASLTMRISNALSMAQGGSPVAKFTTVNFKVGEVDVQVDVTNSTSYNDIANKINAKLIELGLTTVTATTGPDEEVLFSQPTGGYNTGDHAGYLKPIIITNSGPEDLTPGEIEGGDSALDGDINKGWQSTPPESVTTPVTINIELDKVGRDGEGGKLIVGAKELTPGHTSDDHSSSGTRNGIEIFNIKVNGDASRPSNVQQIRSTNETLETVNIANHADWSGASLTVRNGFGEGQEIKLIDATGFDGDLAVSWNFEAVTWNSDASWDIDSIDWSASWNFLQQAVESKFGRGNDSYGWTSSEADAVSSNNHYLIDMGAGNDKVFAVLDGDSVDALDETFTLNAGDGNDFVLMERNDNRGDGVSQNTMLELSQKGDYINIDLGAGDDTLFMNNDFIADIKAGAGDDLVYMKANGTAGEWRIGQTTGAQAFGEKVLFHAKLTLSFAGFEKTVNIQTTQANGYVADQTTINAAVKAAIDGDPVLKKLLSYELIDGTQAMKITANYEGENSLGIAIYQPEYMQGAGVPLDGQVKVTAGDLSALEKGFIRTTTLDSDDFTTVANAVTNITTLGNTFGTIDANGVGNDTRYTEAQYEHDRRMTRGVDNDDIFEMAAGNNYLDYDTGNVVASADSATGANLSTIDMGTGQDIVVMHSNDANAGVLKISDSFGKVAVVNWHAVPTDQVTDAAQAATHLGKNALDFTALLDNRVDPSATPSTESAVPVDITANIVLGAESLDNLSGPVIPDNTNDAKANSVNVIRFVENVTDKFDQLTAQKLVDALNANAISYGNLNNALLDVDTQPAGPNLVIGGIAKHIIMVEDGQNAGRYKVFYVESDHNAATNTNGDFNTTNAKELGEIDFGASVNLMLVGSKPYASFIENMTKAMDNLANGDTTAMTFDFDANGDGTVGSGEGTTTTPILSGPTDATTVDTTQTVTAGGQVTNKLGDTVPFSTIRKIEAGATVTATTADAMSVFNVDGDITISTAAVAVADANTIATKFSGEVTATISEGDMATLNTLTAAGTGTHHYTVSVTDANVDAAELLALQGKTSESVDATGITKITGSFADVDNIGENDGTAGKVDINDAALEADINDAAGTELAAADLADLTTNHITDDDKVTVLNAVKIVGSEADVKAAIVTAGTKVVATTAEVVIEAADAAGIIFADFNGAAVASVTIDDTDDAYTLTGANHVAAFVTNGLKADASDAIEVNGLDTITTVATAAEETFILANTDGTVAITEFAAEDHVQLGGTETPVAVTVGAFGADVEHRVVFDTAANLGASAVSIGDQSSDTNVIHWAVASDSGEIYYDADGDWTAGVTVIGTIAPDAATTLAITNYTVA